MTHLPSPTPRRYPDAVIESPIVAPVHIFGEDFHARETIQPP